VTGLAAVIEDEPWNFDLFIYIYIYIEEQIIWSYMI
jgi:hypothetical protein